MIRTAPDGRQSLIDLIVALTRTGRTNAFRLLQRLTDKGIVPQYETVSLHKGPPTPIVSASQWAEIRSHFPCDDYIARIRMPDDLYVMHYNDQYDYVKIGRSKDVEKRRRDLESGHNFFVTVAAVFHSYGHMETIIHNQLQMFRSTLGAGKEWFNISKDQAIKAIKRALQNHEAPQSLQAQTAPSK